MWARVKKYRPDWLTLVLLGLIVYVWFRPPAWVSDENRMAQEVKVALLDGRQISLEQLRGKVVLVNFWATWCPYCRHEMPAMQAFYQANRSRGFEIVAYSLDKTQAEVDEFMRANGFTFPAPLAAPPVMQAFGGVDRVPLSFVVDREGVIRQRIAGQVHRGRLEKLIEPWLSR